MRAADPSSTRLLLTATPPFPPRVPLDSAAPGRARPSPRDRRHADQSESAQGPRRTPLGWSGNQANLGLQGQRAQRPRLQGVSVTVFQASLPLHKIPAGALHLHLPLIPSKSKTHKRHRERTLFVPFQTGSICTHTRRETQRLRGGNQHPATPRLKKAQRSTFMKRNKTTLFKADTKPKAQQPAIFKRQKTQCFATDSEHTLAGLLFSSASHQAPTERSKRAENPITAETPRQQCTFKAEGCFQLPDLSRALV